MCVDLPAARFTNSESQQCTYLPENCESKRGPYEAVRLTALRASVKRIDGGEQEGVIVSVVPL